MKITVITVGRLKEKFYRDAVAEYEKRLGRYCKLEILQVDDERTPDKASEAEEDLILRKEADHKASERGCLYCDVGDCRQNV